MKILAVIPARGGSKGIPRKNVRQMGKKPLIAHAIENALACPAITCVAVTTDDDEVKQVAARFGALVIDRPAELGGDAVTLDPVVHHATLAAEARTGQQYDVVVTMQPTSPLLLPATLAAALLHFADGGYDTVLSAVNRPHLAWREEGGAVVPAYAQRLNRQQLPANYQETGAFFISRRACVTPGSRFGAKVGIYETGENEAIDIDTLNDWALCESILARKRIVFRTDGHPEIGMGHIYRTLSLAYALVLHQITFVVSRRHAAGAEKIRAYNFRCLEIDDEAEFYAFLEAEPQDVVVLDVLDTEADTVRRLKTLAPRVVSFEDMGPGAAEAHAVVNALYDGNGDRRVFSGERYVCLRNEFLMEAPDAFREAVTEVLVAFGGADPARLTEKLLAAARRIRAARPQVHFTFVLGPAKAGDFANEPGVTVLRDVVAMSALMKRADLAFTSQGRTVFELASLGVPAVVLAQNEREQLHTFARAENGFVNLGLGAQVDEETLLQTFDQLADDPARRRQMRERMLRHDLRGGIARTTRIILEG